ncbi:MAG TPA: proton-translocating transhydrogenase family protein, partial [Kofleriaceae bacterium]|nr:proton-translocating transhydrogenase family protein [Kofleriaceae bacterium]
NDAVRPALVLEGGEKRWPAPPMKKAEAAPAAPAAPAAKPAVKPAPAVAKPAASGGHHAPAPRAPSKRSGVVMSIAGLVLAGLWLYLRYGRVDAAASDETIALVQHVTVFVMAIFVGFQVVWNVTPALHTPLMSVTNAISGIIVVGGLLDGRGALHTSVIVAVVATLFATINIAGGFIVTRRMLAMFRK